MSEAGGEIIMFFTYSYFFCAGTAFIWIGSIYAYQYIRMIGFKIRINLDHVSCSKTDSEVWLKETKIKFRYHDGSMYFRKEADAMHFKLVWG